LKGRAWPWLLAGLLVFGVGVNVGFLIVATGDPSFAVEEDYYGRALRWDDTTREAARNAELGWSVSVEPIPSPKGPGWTDLALSVVDREGTPVTGALVSLEAFHHARAADRLRVDLAPSGERYAATLPMRRAGLWELRVRVEKGGTTFTTVLDRELGGLR
jgi:nitrogen fixation protein FixH